MSLNSGHATSKRTQRIDAVLFDYGSVLSGPANPQAWARMRTITGFDEARLHAAYWAFRHDYDRAALTGEGYWRAVARHGGGSIDEAQLAALLAADVDMWTDLNQPMVDWAVRLQRSGIRTGVLSNLGDAITAGVLARLPWLAAFDHCTWSHSLFLAKPDPKIYLASATALGTDPVNILFIDDREDNVAGALAVGMMAIRYTTHDAFECEMRARGLDALLLAGAEAQNDAIR